MKLKQKSIDTNRKSCISWLQINQRFINNNFSEKEMDTNTRWSLGEVPGLVFDTGKNLTWTGHRRAAPEHAHQ